MYQERVFVLLVLHKNGNKNLLEQNVTSSQRGFYGIDPVLIDENGDEITGNEQKVKH